MLLLSPAIILIGGHFVVHGQQQQTNPDLLSTQASTASGWSHDSNPASDWSQSNGAFSDWARAARSIHGFPPEFLDHVASPQGLISSSRNSYENNINVKHENVEVINENNEETVISADYNEVISERTPEDYSEFTGSLVDEAKVGKVFFLQKLIYYYLDLTLDYHLL